MKKILYSLMALTISFSSIAQKQKQLDKKEDKQQRKEYKADGDLSQKLNLTEDQKRQMKAINQDFKTQMQALKNTGAAKDLKTKREALVRDHQQKIDNILSPEQRIKAEEIKRTHTTKGSGGFHRAGTARKENFGKFDKDLNLTPEQQSKVKALNESLQNKVQNIEKNTSLTEDQKREQVKELRKKHREELQSMLTTEQKANLKSLMKNRPNRKTVK